VKRKNETYHEYYIRNKERFKKQTKKVVERYQNNQSYRTEMLKKQRDRTTLEQRTKNLSEIEELERQWPVTENPDMTEREKMIMLAGLILGEGSLSIYSETCGKYPQFKAVMTLSNTDDDIIKLFNKLFNETDYVYIRTRVKPYSIKWKPVYRLSINKQKIMLYYLIKTRPFLVGRKRKIADIIIDVIKYRLTQPNDVRGRMLVPDIEKKVAEVRELNRRGN
jgi:hypothetical protein